MSAERICFVDARGALACERAFDPSSRVRVALPSPAVEVAVSAGGVCARLASGRLFCAAFELLERVPSARGPNAPALEVRDDDQGIVTGIERAKCVVGSRQGFAVIARSVDPAGHAGPYGIRVDSVTELYEVSLHEGAPIATAVSNTRGIFHVALSPNHLCVVGDGLRCSGDNTYGQLGTGDYQSRAELRQAEWPNGLGHVRLVAASAQHTCAVTFAGFVACFGDSRGGAFGIRRDAKDTQFERIRTSAGPRQFSTVAAGRAHACATTVGGQLLCWGANDQRQLGDWIQSSDTPRVVDGVSRASQVVAWGDRTCVLTYQGAQVRCWGGGFGSKVHTAFTEARALAMGSRGTCALKTRGAVECWSHETLDGTRDYARLATVPVPGLDQVDAIAASGDVLCVLRQSKLLCAFGDDVFRPVEDAVARPLRGGTTMSACLGRDYACAPSPRGVACFDFATARAGSGPIPTTTRAFEPHERGVDFVACGTEAYVRMHSGTTHRMVVKTPAAGGIEERVPLPYSPDWMHAERIATGEDFECGLGGGYDLRCRGDQRYGQLGRGVSAYSPLPVLVPLLAIGER
jgi:hypothetical protein